MTWRSVINSQWLHFKQLCFAQFFVKISWSYSTSNAWEHHLWLNHPYQFLTSVWCLFYFNILLLWFWLYFWSFQSLVMNSNVVFIVIISCFKSKLLWNALFLLFLFHCYLRVTSLLGCQVSIKQVDSVTIWSNDLVAKSQWFQKK